MSGFYSRYVPPSASAATTKQHDAGKPEKRKRAVTERPKEKSKKRTKLSQEEDSHRIEKDQGRIERSPRDAGHPAAKDASVVSKYSATATAEQNHTDVNFRQKQEKSVKVEAEAPETAEVTGRSSKKRPKKPPIEAEAQSESVDEEYNTKHASVLSKFSAAQARKATQTSIETDAPERASPEGTRGLEPIPQPEDDLDHNEKPTYSTLPAWQSNAVKVVHSTQKLFSEFALGNTIVQNLAKQGMQRSFPIQTTVIPLLLDGPGNHQGDVCVSAATGSGKTLAYILPIIQALKDYPTTRLRGIILVPTRELVQQVRQLCEICAAGSSLQIATAVGSKSIKDEQSLLVERQEVYDPNGYQRRQTAPVDWATFSVAKLMRQVQQRRSSDSTNFVERFISKVDLLITTPGRLVDHLKSTDGFDLDYVQWMVVDEADRLLNESYQEWVETVVPALQSQAATAKRDEQLRYMRMDVPKRYVRKVLLSATMTRDIAKLNTLGLENPKLVILGSREARDEHNVEHETLDATEEPQQHEDGAFHLPSSLVEYAVTVKDEAEKPLHLLRLLQTKIMPSSAKTNGHTQTLDDTSSDTDSLESSSDSSDSDLTSSSGDSSSASEDDQPNGASQPTASSKHRPKSQTRALIFTRSTSSAERLSRLLSLLAPALSISTLTRSTTSSSTSRRSLRSFLSGRTAILIATDRASRGLDIPDLEHVISYDVPSSALTYVHRVGRTARAGKAGTAWTLLEWREGRWFWASIGGKKSKGSKVEDSEESIVRSGKVRKWEVRMPEGDAGDSLKKAYEVALKKLGEEVRGNT